MKERVRYWLGAVVPVAVVVLLMVLFLLSSSYSLNNSGRRSLVSGGARKLLSVKTMINPSPSLSSQDQRRAESRARASTSKQSAMKEVGVSMRRIPPSTSNPTQNK